MSRLGRMPISLPKGVEVKVAEDRTVHVKGPKGSLHLPLPPSFRVVVSESGVIVEGVEGTSFTKAEHGLYRSLLKNQVLGVSEGFEILLEMIGVGYRAAVQGTKLDLQVGFSHPTYLQIPQGIQVHVDKGTSIAIRGVDKREVGHFASRVRAIRPPEPYKGKGIRYKDEYVRKKQGKAAKGKA